jgi:hypothetical protein
MVAMIDEGSYSDSFSGEALLAYAHPIFWAPYSLVVDGN